MDGISVQGQGSTTVQSKLNLTDLAAEELEQLVKDLGEPAYRRDQILDWVYRKGVVDIAEMTNLSYELRARLAERAYVGHLPIVEHRRSADGTEKFLFAVAGGEAVEAVVIPEGSRRTACISSQVGCAMGCTFCATALAGLERNLKAWEMVAQLLAVHRATGERVTNVVFMGMGEPLANFAQLMQAIKLMTSPQGLGIGARRITVSTCGIVPRIRELARAHVQVVLAVSLHAADDETRDRIMPINDRYPVAELLDACREYVTLTGRRITFEYILIRDLNDSVDHARQLVQQLQGILCHVNLIPMNPVPETGFERPDDIVTTRFAAVLEDATIPVTVRKEKGTDIEAACGQLRNTQSKS